MPRPGLRGAGGGGEGGQGCPSSAAGAPGRPLSADGSGGAGLCRSLWEGCNNTFLSQPPKYTFAEVKPLALQKQSCEVSPAV